MSRAGGASGEVVTIRDANDVARSCGLHVVNESNIARPCELRDRRATGARPARTAGAASVRSTITSIDVMFW
ncbi:hypothetical protein WS86_19070 [Burkholderia savannae]|nr:hypothetical protein WS86_19070 [Burkholderia savannae]